MSKSKSENLTRHEQLYAITKGKEMVQIDDYHADKEEVYCIYCDCKMIRKRGNVRMHHYAHDYRSMRHMHKDCTYDLYLQAYAKLRLSSWFENAPYINIHYLQPKICKYYDKCPWKNKESGCNAVEERTFDIKKACTNFKFRKLDRTSSLSSTSHYRLFNQEKRNNEIAIVLRACEDDDRERDDLPAGRVIELWMNHENDIDTFTANYDLNKCRTVKYHGFNPKKENSNPSPAQVITLMRFTLYKSGLIYVNNDMECVESYKQRGNIQMQITIDPESRSCNHWQFIEKPDIANWGMAFASGAPFNHKFCAMCKRRHYQNGDYCCQATGEILKPFHNAGNCEDYEANLDRINEKLKEFQKYEETHYVEIVKDNCHK